jgi:NADH-quinone oxidoreductase subunit I
MAEPIPTSRRKALPLGFGESLYLIAILKGMWITLKHVIHNLLKQDFDTIEYPDVRKAMPERYKGAHRLTTRPDGELKCVACMCCSQVCPARCITIEAEETDHPIEKRPLEFQIDMLRCIYCGFCVEACPKDAIRMDTGIYEINAFTRQDMVHNKRYMVDLMDGERPEAEIAYRDEPGMAPAGFRSDEARVLSDA